MPKTLKFNVPISDSKEDKGEVTVYHFDGEIERLIYRDPSCRTVNVTELLRMKAPDFYDELQVLVGEKYPAEERADLEKPQLSDFE